MFIKFNEESQKIIKKAKTEMILLKHPYVGSEHLMLSILNSRTSIRERLNEYGITYDNFKGELLKSISIGTSTNKYFIYTPLLKRVLENSIIDAKESNNNEITIENIFISLLDEGEGVAIRILNNLGVNIDELFLELTSKNNSKTTSKKKTLLNEFGIDLTKKAIENDLDPLIGRNQEITNIIEILSRRTKNNPLLIGDAGVGKTAIVEELAKRIANKDVPEYLYNTKIISLPMASLVAGTKYRGEFEDRISKLLREIESSNDVIIFIDEIHTIVGAGGAEGAIDASNIIKPSLARGKIRLIGATTISEYKNTILKDKALNRRFHTVLVKESTNEETKTILRKIKNIYEDHHHVIVNDDIIDRLVDLCDKYIFNRKNPDKAIDILDEVCAKVSLIKSKDIIKLKELEKELEYVKDIKNSLIINHNFEDASILKNKELFLENKINEMNFNILKKDVIKTITINDIADVIYSKTSIPIYEVNKENSLLNTIEVKLNNKIIGQESAIKLLVNITKKIKLGYKNDNLPYSMLFIGNTGVGKTFLVKEYAKLLNMNLIRLDMSEYKESHTISKIIGSPPGYIGYDNNKNVLEKIKDNPYSIILLDEIEKSSNDVLNLFLQVLDEGIMNDSSGSEISFKNTIIIMTSNIGCNKEVIGFSNNDNIKNELKNYLSPEFVNRINNILYFNKLNLENIHKIVDKKTKEIKDKFKKDDIIIKISKKFIEDIINKSEYEIYGARKLNKLLEQTLDDIVIDEILKGKKNINIKS